MFDVIVVGGGHAGCEAALASANIGLNTILITGNLNMVGSMPCNPSIGGPAKGVVVREIDALGGYMGKNADLCQIQTKMLNQSKGPAVWALRFQEDKLLYVKEMKKHLMATKNLTLKEAIVEDLKIEDKTIKGVYLDDGSLVLGKTVVLTTGTYLSSRILRGSYTSEEGPDGQKTQKGVSKALRNAGFTIQRLKTGTPARIKASTIDFSKAEIEWGSEEVLHYSFDKGYDSILNVRKPCYLTYTNKEIHDIILANLDKSSMYSGLIEGIGPRYCPSIETKLVRFKDKERHQIFYEPESLELDQEYIQGFSNSLPDDIQDKILRLLPGLENCEVVRYSYAIEYDAIDPLELWPSLETKLVKNLFTAGQINGTSGYEEAAGQGLIAGINAALKVQGKEPLILKRDEAYIGVMIDDLVTKGTEEPYRLLTSRSEYRLLLRHDNADLRLREKGYQVGLIDEKRYQRLKKKIMAIDSVTEQFKNIKIHLTDEVNNILEKYNSSKLTEGQLIEQLIKRPEINYNVIKELLNASNETLNIDYDDPDDILEAVEIHFKYDGYIKKSKEQALRMRSFEDKIIPDNINYDLVDNIALEAREKFKKVNPKTIGQAMRISGVNPADISVLVVYVEKLLRSN